jgi:hypothetical protein
MSSYPIAVRIIGSNEIPIMSRQIIGHHKKCLKQSETSDDSYEVQRNNYIICTTRNNNSEGSTERSGVDVPNLRSANGCRSSYISDCSDTNHQYVKIDLKQFENSHPHIMRLGPPLIEVKPYMRFMYTNILGASNESNRLDALNSSETEQLCNKV